MSPNIAKASGGAGLRRVRPPGSLLLALSLQASSKPALNVRGADRLNLPQFARLDHLASLADERVTGVVVGDGEDDFLLRDGFRQLFRLLQVEGQRLVAKNVEARLDRGLGDLEMSVVGRRHRDKVHSLVRGALELALDELLVRAVGTSG